MGIGDDQTFRCLPEDLSQADGGDLIRIDQVLEHVARADGRQLIRVTDHDQSCGKL